MGSESQFCEDSYPIVDSRSGSSGAWKSADNMSSFVAALGLQPDNLWNWKSAKSWVPCKFLDSCGGGKVIGCEHRKRRGAYSIIIFFQQYFFFFSFFASCGVAALASCLPSIPYQDAQETCRRQYVDRRGKIVEDGSKCSCRVFSSFSPEPRSLQPGRSKMRSYCNQYLYKDPNSLINIFTKLQILQVVASVS